MAALTTAEVVRTETYKRLRSEGYTATDAIAATQAARAFRRAAISACEEAAAKLAKAAA